jgi:hypothetical protein
MASLRRTAEMLYMELLTSLISALQARSRRSLLSAISNAVVGNKFVTLDISHQKFITILDIVWKQTIRTSSLSESCVITPASKARIS